jgi:hypothetical protein
MGWGGRAAGAHLRKGCPSTSWVSLRVQKWQPKDSTEERSTVLVADLGLHITNPVCP